jgi:hypothetical protein
MYHALKAAFVGILAGSAKAVDNNYTDFRALPAGTNYAFPPRNDSIYTCLNFNEIYPSDNASSIIFIRSGVPFGSSQVVPTTYGAYIAPLSYTLEVDPTYGTAIGACFQTLGLEDQVVAANTHSDAVDLALSIYPYPDATEEHAKKRLQFEPESKAISSYIPEAIGKMELLSAGQSSGVISADLTQSNITCFAQVTDINNPYATATVAFNSYAHRPFIADPTTLHTALSVNATGSAIDILSEMVQPPVIDTRIMATNKGPATVLLQCFASYGPIDVAPAAGAGK